MQSRLREGRISASVCGKLGNLANALGSRDFRAAQRINAEMATSDWKETKEWGTGLRYLLALAVAKAAYLGVQ